MAALAPMKAKTSLEPDLVDLAPELVDLAAQLVAECVEAEFHDGLEVVEVALGGDVRPAHRGELLRQHRCHRSDHT
jgi:hypothetical protein